MDFSTLVNDSREAESALGVVFFVAQKAMQEANISSETLDQFQSAMETTLENLDDDDKLMLAYVIDRRISETPFPGWVLFKSRLTTVEAHILSHALKDKGYDNRIRRDHESAADALYPSKGGEIWIRPWHLKVARALVDELKAREESAVVCAACSEESPAHFSSCWNCGAQLEQTELR